jgi:hypothetical protein
MKNPFLFQPYPQYLKLTEIINIITMVEDPWERHLLPAEVQPGEGAQLAELQHYQHTPG